MASPVRAAASTTGTLRAGRPLGARAECSCARVAHPSEVGQTIHPKTKQTRDHGSARGTTPRWDRRARSPILRARVPSPPGRARRASAHVAPAAHRGRRGCARRGRQRLRAARSDRRGVPRRAPRARRAGARGARAVWKRPRRRAGPNRRADPQSAQPRSDRWTVVRHRARDGTALDAGPGIVPARRARDLVARQEERAPEARRRAARDAQIRDGRAWSVGDQGRHRGDPREAGAPARQAARLAGASVEPGAPRAAAREAGGRGRSARRVALDGGHARAREMAEDRARRRRAAHAGRGAARRRRRATSARAAPARARSAPQPRGDRGGVRARWGQQEGGGVRRAPVDGRAPRAGGVGRPLARPLGRGGGPGEPRNQRSRAAFSRAVELRARARCALLRSRGADRSARQPDPAPPLRHRDGAERLRKDFVAARRRAPDDERSRGRAVATRREAALGARGQGGGGDGTSPRRERAARGAARRSWLARAAARGVVARGIARARCLGALARQGVSRGGRGDSGEDRPRRRSSGGAAHALSRRGRARGLCARPRVGRRIGGRALARGAQRARGFLRAAFDAARVARRVQPSGRGRHHTGS
jgi:hypothetical protein